MAKEIDLGYDESSTWNMPMPSHEEGEEEMPKKHYPKLCLYGDGMGDLPDEGTCMITFRKVVTDTSGEIPRVELEVHTMTEPTKATVAEPEEREDPAAGAARELDKKMRR